MNKYTMKTIENNALRECLFCLNCASRHTLQCAKCTTLPTKFKEKETN